MAKERRPQRVLPQFPQGGQDGVKTGGSSWGTVWAQLGEPRSSVLEWSTQLSLGTVGSPARPRVQVGQATRRPPFNPHQVDGEDCPVGPEDCPSGPRSLPDTTGTDGDSDNMTLSDPSLPPGVTPTNSQGSPIPTEEAARRKCGEPHFGGPSGHQCPPSPLPLLYLGAYADERAWGRGGVCDLPACDWRGTPMTGTGAP